MECTTLESKDSHEDFEVRLSELAIVSRVAVRTSLVSPGREPARIHCRARIRVRASDR